MGRRDHEPSICVFLCLFESFFLSCGSIILRPILMDLVAGVLFWWPWSYESMGVRRYGEEVL